MACLFGLYLVVLIGVCYTLGCVRYFDCLWEKPTKETVFTIILSEDEQFDSVEISQSHFGANFVVSADYEFTPGSQNSALLQELGAQNLRYPGGTATELYFDMTNPNSTDPRADNTVLDNGNTSLIPMDTFFQTAGEVGASVTLVVPTKVGFAQSAGQALAVGADGEAGNYGARTELAATYLQDAVQFVQDALDAAALNGVTITTIEIGNEFWGSGQMTASEYGYLSGKVAAALHDEFPNLELFVQATDSANEFSPRYDEMVYIEPVDGDFIVHTPRDYKDLDIPDHWDLRKFEENGSGRVQTEAIATEFAKTVGAIDGLAGVIQHGYFDEAFDSIDTENFFSLTRIPDIFKDALDAELGFATGPLKSIFTEWGARDRDDSDNIDHEAGLLYASMLNEAFFELVSSNVAAANVWPLTYADETNLGRPMIDTQGGDLTLGGTLFKMLSETLIGQEAVLDFEVAGQIDVHGYGSDAKFTTFISERSGQSQSVDLDYSAFMPVGSGLYFSTITQLTTNGNPTNNSSNPVVNSIDVSGVVSGSQVQNLSLDAWSVTRVEWTAVTDGADKIVGYSGDDVLFGGAGADEFTGGAGADMFTFQAGDGQDTIYDFEYGLDILRYDGVDLDLSQVSLDWVTYRLAEGTLVNFGNGDTVLLQGTDLNGHFTDTRTYTLIEGTAGDDIGPNSLQGSNGNDEILGLAGDDRILGNNGNNRLVDGNGLDNLIGGSGSDVFVLTANDGEADCVRQFDQGQDFIDLRGWGVTSFDQLSLVEINSVITEVSFGAETLKVRGSDDSGFSMVADDFILGAAGSTLIGDGKVTGTSGDDLINGTFVDADGNGPTAEGDVIYAEAGNDVIEAGGGSDLIYAGSGEDLIYGGGGRDTIYGNKSNDRLYGEGSRDYIEGNSGRDKIYGGSAQDVLKGGKGSDRLFGGTGADDLYGENGNDRVVGGKGADSLTGGIGSDAFEFKAVDLINWSDLTGTVAEKYAQIDVINDFEIGNDVIRFDAIANTNGLDDLSVLEFTSPEDGNQFFVVRVLETNDRILVDVDDGTSLSDFWVTGNFEFV